MTDKYILRDGNVVPEPNALAWAKWFEDSRNERQIAKDSIGAALVSTVFLGLDHSFGGATPILWETMIFGGPHDGHQERYATRDEALAGHQKAVEMCEMSVMEE